jgi:CheY-like chemotaxis protein
MSSVVFSLILIVYLWAMGRIVVIDDDEDILEIMQLILQDVHEVTTSICGLILKQLGTVLPDLIIIDDWLQNEKGSELCRQLKQDPVTAKIPVLLFTAQHNGEKIAKEAGANGFISKPFDLESLLEQVNSFFVSK